jgi:colicin import membrane protein
MIPTTSEAPGKRKALAFTLTVHGLLVLALFFGVQWKRNTPEVMEVELWSSVPTPALQAPPPPPPPEVKPEPPKPEPKPVPKVEPKPEPKKPDIALKEEKKKPEPKKPEPPKPEPKPEPKKPEVKPQPPVDPFKEMLEREQKQLKTANNQAQLKAAADAEQRAAAGRRGLQTWGDKIKQRIRSNIVPPPGLTGNPVAVFAVTQLPTGEIIDVRLKRSSGFTAYDTAIERAIWKSSPLPKPDDASLFQRSLDLTFCPDEERGCR